MAGLAKYQHDGQNSSALLLSLVHSQKIEAQSVTHEAMKVKCSFLQLHASAFSALTFRQQGFRRYADSYVTWRNILEYHSVSPNHAAVS